MNSELQILIDAKIRTTMDDLAKVGCMMTVIVLFPAEQGFNLGSNSNIPDPKLRLEVLDQVAERERDAQGLSKPLILPGVN